jgi:Icc-related predicted phosphoesterase
MKKPLHILGACKMKIDAIADTHGLVSLHGILGDSKADMLILAGDFTRNTKAGSVYNIIQEIVALPHKHKLIVPGNHDGMFEHFSYDWDKHNIDFLTHGTNYLNGILFACSAYTPKFCDWWFMRDEKTLNDMWERFIPRCGYGHTAREIDVLVTHGPPHGILDKNMDGHHCGSTSLRDRLPDIAPKIHIFGHIHEAFGHTKIGDTDYYNVSVLDGHYDHVNPVTRIEL